MSDNNTYKPESPEWQLFELAESADHAATAFYADAQRFMKKSAEQRDKAAAFRAALDKLAAP